MRNLYNRRVEITDARHLVLTSTASDLRAQLGELNQLRERVRKAQMMTMTSRWRWRGRGLFEARCDDKTQIETR